MKTTLFTFLSIVSLTALSLIGSAATIFYSTGSGDFNDGSTWVGGVAPTTTDHWAYIRNGHNVTVTANESIGQIRVFGHSSGTNFTINAGVTVTLSVYFINVGGSSSSTSNVAINGSLNTPRYVYWMENKYPNLTVNTSGTGTITCTNDVLFTSVGVGATFNHSVANTVATFCNTNTKSGATYTQTVNLSGVMTLSTNLILNAESSALASNTNFNMSSSTAELTLRNIVMTNNGGTLTSTASNGTINFLTGGTILADSKVTYGKINVASGTVTLGGALGASNFLDDLTISSGATLNMNSNELGIGGDLNCSGTLTTASGVKLILGGSSAQVINYGSAVTIPQLAIENTGGGVSITGSDVTVSELLSFDATGTTALTTGGKLIMGNTDGTMANVGNLNNHTISGNVTCQFRTGTLTDIGYRHFAMPFSGKTLSDYQYHASTNTGGFETYGYTGSNTPSAGGYSSCYFYDNGSVTGDFDDGWVAPTNATNTLNSQLGIIVYCGPGSTGGASSYSFDISGTINTGTQTISAANGANFSYDAGNASDNNYNWALIGNPYPSTLNWTAVSKNDIESTAYIFSEDGGGYVSSTSIPPFQAFWVRTSGASSSLTIDEADKSTTQTAFQKSFQDEDEITIYIKSDQTSKFSLCRIVFDPNEDDHYNKERDAYRLKNPWPWPNVALMSSDGEALQIDVTDNSSSHKVIPIQVEAHLAGKHSLEFDNLDKVEGCLILEDKDLGTFVAIDEVNNSYSFNLLSGAATANRFNIHLYEFVKNTDVVNSTCYGSNTGMIEVDLHNLGSAFNLHLVNSQGLTTTSIGNANGKHTFSNLAPGNYSIKVSNTSLKCPETQEYVTIMEPQEMLPSFELRTISGSNEMYINEEVSFDNVSTGGISSYNWRFGDQESSSLMSPTHSYAEAGIYEVILEVGNGNNDCNKSTSMSVEVVDHSGVQVGVDNLEESDITVINNNQILNLIGQLPFKRFEITELSGRQAGFGEIDENSDEVNISIEDLNSGIYILNLQGDEGVFTHRFVKK